MKVSSKYRAIMEAPLRMRHERKLSSGRKSRSIGKMRLIRGYFMTRDGTKLKEEKRKDSRGQLVDTQALKAHRAGAMRMEREWNVQDGRSRVDVERRVVLRESAYTPRSLHPPSSYTPFFLFACPPTLQPLSAMAPSARRLHCIADAWSVTRL